MHMLHMFQRLLPLVLAVGMISTIGTGIAAQTDPFGPVPITIHNASCPVDHPGSIYDDCHANGLAGVPFEIRGFEMATQNVVTDENGAATAMILENMSVTSDITIIQDSAVFGSFLGAYVYCSDQNSGAVIYDGMASDGGAVYFETLSTEQYVICDWYNLEAGGTEPPGNGQSDSVPASAGGEPVASLPTTGTGPATDRPWQGAFIVFLLISLLALSIRPETVRVRATRR